jgi:hypothetical protein
MSIFIKAGLWLEKKTGYKGEFNLTKFVENLIATTPSGQSYKVYTALLKQEGINDPVAIILENTLDETPVWSRDSIGRYRLSAVNEIFKINKTVSFIGHNYDTPLATWQFGRADGNASDTEKVVWLQIYANASGSSIDINTSSHDTYVEIRVYN